MNPSETRILVCDELAPIALERFHARGFEPTVRTGLDEAALIELVPEFDALIVRSATRITRPIIDAATSLSVIGRAGIGVDNVDCAAATERGIVVMNTPTGNTTTTGELAIALLCSLARHVPLGDRTARGGTWSKKGLVGTEITGKTLGVIGFGRIGRVVAERALGLRMEVVAFDPYLGTDAPSPVAGAELVDKDTLLERSDFITLHVPLTDSTRHTLSWEEFARMRPGVRIINAARGGVVDEEALLDALNGGKVAGAALDVFEQEPPTRDNPLLTRDDVIVTPHLGASSAEAQRRVAVDIAEQMSDFLADGVARNAVNLPSLPSETQQQVAPFLLLAEQIGKFLSQRLSEPIRKLELTVSGEVARHGLQHLHLALLVGVLRPTLGTGVNFVNAPMVARERGLRVLEATESDGYYNSGQVKVRASTRGGENSSLVTGAVFGRKPRLVRVDSIHLDLPPEGALLLTRHDDEPGVVGQLGTVLGKHGRNIRRIELGSSSNDPEGLATGFLALDEAPDPAVLTEIESLAPVREVRLIRL